MKKILLFTPLLLFFILPSFTQTPDTIITRLGYTSYYSKELKIPVFVAYKLYRGGGDCSRKKMYFKNDIDSLPTAKTSDYAKTGYDIGHLANAEDFASYCPLEEQTFRFYNAIPQTKNLNRGIWKAWETLVREESQSDSLFIICGGIFSGKKTIGKDSIAVPELCFKVVQSLSTKTIIHIILYTNKKKDNKAVDVTMKDIYDRLGYDFTHLFKK